MPNRRTSDDGSPGLPLLEKSGLAAPGELLSPRESQRRALASFSRKVELLEGWAGQGLPEGQFWPQTQTELRRWHQPELGAVAWSSPNVASRSGPYADLRRRFDQVVRRLEAQGPERRMPELAQERMKRIAVERRAEALSLQIAEVLAHNSHLQRLLSVSDSRREALKEQLERYEERYGKLLPLDSGRR